ncbi:histidine phosphatase superfamily [Pavlovales sp. CCMP2436]|nr:histidine phosphatase superfamily [Pavlovales sp. CCMP2436]
MGTAAAGAGRTGPLVALLRPLRRLLDSLWMQCCCAIAKGVEEYRKSHRPKSIFLVRHGQSSGNVNESIYSVIADHAIELTDHGHDQARAAGKFLRKEIGDDSVHCFHSPYKRASQTLGEIVKAFEKSKLAIREDPLLREQEFGNFQNVEKIQNSKAERRRYGRFWYRFDNGESGADVHNRAADFLATLYRQMDLSNRRADNYVILAHGLFIRLLCMRYMGWTVAQFEEVWNPSNCEVWRFDRQPDGKYFLKCAYRPEEGLDGVSPHPAHCTPPLVHAALL